MALFPRCLRVKVLDPVDITEMAEEMVPSQMLEEEVFVHKAGVAELAERVAPVGGIVCVPFTPVSCQLGTRVDASLMGEDLEKNNKGKFRRKKSLQNVSWT